MLAVGVPGAQTPKQHSSWPGALLACIAVLLIEYQGRAGLRAGRPAVASGSRLSHNIFALSLLTRMQLAHMHAAAATGCSHCRQQPAQRTAQDAGCQRGRCWQLCPRRWQQRPGQGSWDALHRSGPQRPAVLACSRAPGGAEGTWSAAAAHKLVRAGLGGLHTRAKKALVTPGEQQCSWLQPWLAASVCEAF